VFPVHRPSIPHDALVVVGCSSLWPLHWLCCCDCGDHHPSLDHSSTNTHRVCWRDLMSCSADWYIGYWRQNCKYLSIQQDAFVWSRQIRPFSLSSLSILFVIDRCPLILHRCLKDLCLQVSAVWQVVASTCKVPLPEFSKPNLSKYLLTSNYFFGVASSLWRWSALPNFCNRATWLFIVHHPRPHPKGFGSPYISAVLVHLGPLYIRPQQ
jgi:hypothetical protein